MRHHFSDIWAMNLNLSPASGLAAVLNISKEYFPYVFKGRDIELLRLDFMAVPKETGNMTFDSEIFHLLALPEPGSAVQPTLVDAQDSGYGLPTAQFDPESSKNETGEWEIRFPSTLTELSGELNDLLIVCKYSVKAIN